MKKAFKAFSKLTQLKQSLPVLVFATLLGAASIQTPPGIDLIAVLLANILVSWVFFIQRNLQFAALDLTKPQKHAQNPIVSGDFKLNLARFLWVFFAVLAIALYALTNTKTLISGLALLLITILLNWRKAGLQRFFYLRTDPYQWLINGFFCLLGSLSINQQIKPFTLLSIAFIVFILLYITIIDELRQPETHYSVRFLSIAAIISLTLACCIAAALFFVIRILPYWIVGLFILLLLILLLPQILERLREKKKPIIVLNQLRTPLFHSAAIALIIHFIVPILYQLILK